METPPAATPAYLAELTIRDFAIIDVLRIEWMPGFNVITGETGAGKSIIIDALGVALGDRAGAEWIRAGAARASVEAIVALASGHHPSFDALAELGWEPEDDQIIVGRDIHAGRSVSRINGRAVPVAVVQQVAEELVDVHSQASHLSLLRVKEHLGILDRYAHGQALRGEMTKAVRALNEVRREIRRLEESERQAEREAVLLRHEVEEIDAAAPQEGEEEQLAGQRTRLKNALRLQQLAQDAHEALQGGDEGRGALDLLSEAAGRLDDIRALDTSFELGSERLIELLDAAEELDRTVRHYAEAIEDDPGALDTLEERLLALADLKRKYGATLQDVVAYRDDAARRLGDIEHREERIAELREQTRDLEQTAARIAADLSAARAAAAHTLEVSVERELEDLGMGGTQFVVRIERQPDPQGIALEGESEPVSYDESGVDQVEFLFSANPGEPPRSLARIASGGELARFMLALKSVLSSVDETPVLIFDELDQGVGGRMGHVIGEKLWQLARHHHVLCITHLPQVASYADAHYVVAKSVDGGRTTTTVTPLDPEERIQEIALMLAGPNAGPAARRSAEELVSRAAEWKEEA